jgi:hypothetical protein
MYGSGSGTGTGSRYQQAKILRKTLIPTVLRRLSLKNYVNVPSKSSKQKNLGKKLFFVGVLLVNGENSRIRSGSVSQRP